MSSVNLIEAIVLGLVQGLTEFLPVSSSGHLLLLHEAVGMEESGLMFDVALHMGTLLALVIFFHKDIAELIRAIFIRSDKTRLAWLLALATVPAVIGGILLQDAAETSFRSPWLVVGTMSGVGWLMLLAEKLSVNRKRRIPADRIGWRRALIIGLAQAVALVPGVSRSGATITTGFFLGLDRVAATRFSFLLAIPVTFGAVIKVVISPEGLEAVNGNTGLFLAGIVSAFLSGTFAIRFLLKFLSRHSLKAFAYYRIGLAAVVLIILI